MKRFLTALQWLAVAAIAAWVAVDCQHRDGAPDLHRDSWKNWSGFHALSYPGVTRKAGDQLVSHDTLREHLAALLEAGYTPITPADALAFLRREHPLPDQALLLIFEGGRKDSFLWPNGLLRQNGISAVLGVPTSVTRKWGSFHLRKSDLRRAGRSSNWTLASMGDQAVSTLLGADGHTRGFLSTRLTEPGAPESTEAYAARVEADFAAAAQLLEALSGSPPATYIFPHSDDGTGRRADPEAAGLIHASLTRHHSLAFAKNSHPFNGSDEDPHRLSRLIVPGSWSAERLLTELARHEPRRTPLQGLQASDWTVRGMHLFKDEVLKLGFDGGAVLRGTEHWNAAEVDSEVSLLKQAAVSVLLRRSTLYSIRVTLSESSLLVLEYTGAQPQTLLREAGVPGGPTHRLHTRVQGRRLWVSVGDRSYGPLPLTHAAAFGSVGLTSREGVTTVHRFSAAPLPSAYALHAEFAEIPEQDRAGFAAVLPDWLSSGEAPAFTPAQVEAVLLADAHGVETIPLVTAGTPLEPDTAAAWAGALARTLDTQTPRPPIQRVALEGLRPHLASALRTRGFSVLHVVDTDQAGQLRPDDGLPAPGDELLLHGPPDAVAPALDHLLQHIPTTHLVAELAAGPALLPGLRQAVSFAANPQEISP